MCSTAIIGMGAFCGLQRLPDAFFEKPNRMRAPLEQEVWIGKERAQDGRKAMIEYEAQAVTTRKKTARKHFD